MASSVNARRGTQRAKPVPPKGNTAPRDWGNLLAPIVWAGPAVLFVGILLFYPLLNTIWLSFLGPDSVTGVGLKNYWLIFTDPGLLATLRNNVVWIVLGTVATVFFGLVIAVLVDRVRIESVVKATIFVPMAISFVGAGVIWRFVYVYASPGTTQIGLLDALITRFGAPPVAWLTNTNFDNLALIAVYVWMWTGFCMVIISAALKGVPTDILEAARVDGASELRIFFRIIVPYIAPTLAVVATTMVINLLKIFDIVYVMTGGNFGTDVVALEYYNQLFVYNNFGVASALAVLLMIAVIPIMIFNIKRFREQEATR